MNVILGNPVAPIPNTVLVEPKYCQCCGNLFFRPVVLELIKDIYVNRSTRFCGSCTAARFGKPDSEAAVEFKHNTHFPPVDRRYKRELRRFRRLKYAHHVSAECKEFDAHELNCPDLECGCSCHKEEK